MFLCDTNVIGQLYARKPNQKVTDWIAEHEGMAISEVTVHEILFRLRRIEAVKKEEKFWWNLTYLTVLPLTREEADLSATLRAEESRSGRILHLADSLIAATAIRNDCTLATRNIKDFANCPVRLFNPF